MNTHTAPLLLLCLSLAGSVLSEGGQNGITLFYNQFRNTKTIGPTNVTITGPETVTVGIPYSFVCSAVCTPSCNYTMEIDGQKWSANELDITVNRLVNSLTVRCTVKNRATGHTAIVFRALQVTDGPTNVEVSGPTAVTPGSSFSYQCSARCYPSCNYTWSVDGRWVSGHGNELMLSPSSSGRSEILICKAQNNVSGLYATDIKTVNFTDGPINVTISGPDAVDVGVQYHFVCSALCFPGCNYTWGVDGRTTHGNEMPLTVHTWVSSKVLTCRAQNILHRGSATATKTVYVTGMASSRNQGPETTMLVLLNALALALVSAVIQP